MRVHAARHLGVATLEVVRHHKFLEHVRRLHAHDVRAEQLAVLLVADDLDLTAAVAIDRARTHGAHRDLADHHVMTGLLRLLLGEAEARHLRVAERGPRDVVVLDRVGIHPGRILHRDHALVGSLVGERRADRTRSPIAYTPFSDVRIAPSTSTWPVLSLTLIPASSSPSPSTSGPRPAAMQR